MQKSGSKRGWSSEAWSCTAGAPEDRPALCGLMRHFRVKVLMEWKAVEVIHKACGSRTPAPHPSSWGACSSGTTTSLWAVPVHPKGLSFLLIIPHLPALSPHPGTCFLKTGSPS